MAEYWTTPIKLVPEQYRTATITDRSGRVKKWEEVDPEYEIYTDINGKPLPYNPAQQNTTEEPIREFGTTGAPMYSGVDLSGQATAEDIR